MGKLTLFDLRVDGGNLHHRPDADGELTVSGHVLLELQSATQLNYLKICLSGSSECRWSEKNLDYRIPKYSFHQLIKDEEMLLKSNGRPAVLDAGIHRIPFQFRITNGRHLPSTYIGRFGHVAYSLAVRMDRTGVASDDKISTNLVLNNPRVLDFSQPMTAASFDGERTDCCLCCASGPVIVKATINRTTLKMNSDNVIDVTLHMDNMKSKSLVPKVYIEEVAYFRADGATMCSVNKLCATEGHPVKANTRKNVVELQVGPIKDLISGSIESPHISVFYRITVRMKGSGFRKDHLINVGVDKHWSATPNTLGQPLYISTAPAPANNPAYPPVDITIYPPPRRYR